MMPDIYEVCPTLKGATLVLRPVVMEDAEDLLQVYGDPANGPFFNSDNCHGDTFHYPTLERMQQALVFWLDSYRWRCFVRWSVIERQRAIGTVECFRRETDGNIPTCGLLRIDLRQDRDTARLNGEILDIMLPRLEEMFGTGCAVIKAPPLAERRIEALQARGFVPSPLPLLGEGGVSYNHYWIKSP